jgi:hypothetical protein
VRAQESPPAPAELLACLRLQPHPHSSPAELLACVREPASACSRTPLIFEEQKGESPPAPGARLQPQRCGCRLRLALFTTCWLSSPPLLQLQERWLQERW